MAHVVLMPKAGQSMTEGRVVTWLKKEGDSVGQGEPLLEIETDKANLEIESQESGVLRRIFIPEGEVCPVLMPIGVIGSADEKIDFKALEKRPTPAPRDDGEKAPSTDAGRKESRSTVTPPPPAAAAAPHQPGPRVLASPVARRLATERGVDLESLRGSGPGGRILKRDVERAPSRTAMDIERAFPLPGQAPPYPPPSPRPPARVPFEGMRGAIASTLKQSKSTIPHFYATVAVDMTAALALKRERASQGMRLTVNDLVVHASTRALIDEPRVNCRVFDDHIEHPEEINIGLAVGGDEGLFVPVLLGTQGRDLEGLARESRRITELARRGKLVGTGQGTFTISNLGMFGVESFAAIINPPEGAVLAVGAIRQQLVPATGGFFPRSILKLTLSSDHRAIDGVLAARFLARVRYWLEEGK